MATDDSPPDDSGGAYSFQYSSDEDGQPVKAIVKAVSWVKGLDVRGLDPLYSVINIELLTECFEGGGREFYRKSNRSGPNDLQMTFHYEGCEVTVTTDQIHVKRAPSARNTSE